MRMIMRIKDNIDIGIYALVGFKEKTENEHQVRECCEYIENILLPGRAEREKGSSLKIDNASFRFSFWGERLLKIELSGFSGKSVEKVVEVSVNTLIKRCAQILNDEDSNRYLGLKAKDAFPLIQQGAKDLKAELKNSSLIFQIFVRIMDYFFPPSKYLDDTKYKAAEETIGFSLFGRLEELSTK